MDAGLREQPLRVLGELPGIIALGDDRAVAAGEPPAPSLPLDPVVRPGVQREPLQPLPVDEGHRHPHLRHARPQGLGVGHLLGIGHQLVPQEAPRDRLEDGGLPHPRRDDDEVDPGVQGQFDLARVAAVVDQSEGAELGHRPYYAGR